MSRDISVNTERCAIHDSYLLTVNMDLEDLTDWHAEAIEGAIEGYMNAVGCTECTALELEMSVYQYIDLFVDKTLPIITRHILTVDTDKFTKSVDLNKIKRLYG